MNPSKMIAAAMALSGTAAFAQSSVTLYGTADAGIGKVQSMSIGPNDVINKTKMISGSLMNNSTSNIGVAGREDLGGGMMAGFNLESNLDLNDGANLGAGGGFWGRQAKVWLQGASWGTFQMGRLYNPSFLALAGWQLTGVANYSVVGNTYNWGGNSVRQSSMFGYRTPNMGGFTVEMGYVMKADNVIAGVESSKWDVAATYASGPLVASLSANKVAGAKTSAALGGRYKIGQQFAVATSYSHAANGQNIRNGFSLGGQGTFDLLIVTLDLTRDTKNEWGAKKYTNALLEGRYALSKRTFIYAAYLNLDSTHNYGLGVRHNF